VWNWEKNPTEITAFIGREIGYTKKVHMQKSVQFGGCCRNKSLIVHKIKNITVNA
jgi:hypothetical protein